MAIATAVVNGETIKFDTEVHSFPTSPLGTHIVTKETLFGEL